MKSQIINEVKRLCLLALVPVPEIRFDVKGTDGGNFTHMVKSKEHWLDFNLLIAEDNQVEYITRTVMHEIAHYVRWMRNGKVGDRSENGRRDSHGAKWRAVMVELGATDITRCHSYDVAHLRARKIRKFEYQCVSCGTTYELTTIKHNRLLRNERHYVCHNDKANITLVGELK